MNMDLVNKLALEAGWVPIPHADFFNSLQEDYNRRLVTAVVQECARKAAQLRHVYPHQAELTKDSILEHFGLEETA